MPIINPFFGTIIQMFLGIETALISFFLDTYALR
jgi:hypothetical protein